MNIAAAKNPRAFVTTRRALLSHLWGVGLHDCNVFREGPLYTCRIGNTLHQTHIRGLCHTSYQWWEDRVRKGHFQ